MPPIRIERDNRTDYRLISPVCQSLRFFDALGVFARVGVDADDIARVDEGRLFTPTFDFNVRSSILLGQMASARPPQGGEQQRPSKHVFDGLSHAFKRFFVHHTYVLVESSGIYQT